MVRQQPGAHLRQLLHHAHIGVKGHHLPVKRFRNLPLTLLPGKRQLEHPDSGNLGRGERKCTFSRLWLWYRLW